MNKKDALKRDLSNRDILRRIIPYVPPYWVRQAFADPAHTLVGREERIYAAVLFVDISGFTTIAEALSRRGREGMEELSALLDRYFMVMSEPVIELGGEVVKFAGDALIVTFPAQPDGGDAHLGAALHCALRMQEAMTGFAHTRTSAGVFPLRMKIGIGEGAIYNNTVGDEDKEMQHVFAGRPLARCQQAEGHAGAGEIVADAALINRIPGRLDIGEARDTFRPIYHATDVPVLPPIQQPDVDALEAQQAAQLIRRLSPYLPRQLVERIRQGQRGIYGEHRRVTVMFVKFGGLNYDWEPQVGEALQIYYSTMRDCILRYGGRLNEVDIGSSGGTLVVFFGAPTAHEDDELRAVRCAWEMQQSVVDVRIRAGASAGRLRQCIGISSDTFFVGDVGAPVRRTYAAVGDEVNLASRLMNLAEWGEVIVTRWVEKQAVSRFDFEAMGKIKVKGKVEPVTTFVLLAPRSEVADHTQAVDLADRRPLIGREDELAVLKAVQGRAWRGAAQLLSISGEAGVGKSRLVGELAHEWIRDGGMVCVGECHRRGDKIDYEPWIDMLRTVFNIQERDAPDRQREKIASQLVFLSPSLANRQPVVYDLFELGAQQALAPSREQRIRRQETIVEFFTTLARRQPLLLIVDGFHNIDRESLAVLDELTARAGVLPLVVCILYRPTADSPQPAQGEIATTRIVLTELDEENSLALAHWLLQDVGLATEWAASLVDQAQGNPLYLQEMVRALLDAEDAQAVLHDGTIIPDEIAELVQARIDLLDEDTKLTLRIAAVIGRRFELSVLRAAHPMPISRTELQERLEMLKLGRIIHQERDAPGYYFFEQEMTRQVIYSRLLSVDRARLHRRVAQAIQDTRVQDLPEQYELLADHLERGNEWGPAVTCLLDAGRRAVDLNQDRRAVAFYDRAEALLRICETDESQRSFVRVAHVDLLLERGALLRRLMRTAPAEADYRQAVQLARALGDLEAQGIALRRLAELLFHQARYNDAQFFLRQALQRFLALDDGGNISHLLRLNARLHTAQGHFSKAEQYTRQAIQLAQDRHHAAASMYGQVCLGDIQQRVGDLDLAIDTLQHVLASADAALESSQIIQGVECLVQALLCRGQWGHAISLAQQRVEAPDGAEFDAALVSRMWGLILTQIGDYRPACAHLERAIEIFERAGWRQSLLPCLWTYGEALIGLERPAQAAGYFERALAMGQSSNTVLAIISAKLGLSKLAAIDKNWTAEQRLCTEARAMARRVGLDTLVVAAKIGLARAYLGHREWRAAQREALLARDKSHRLRCTYNVFRSEAMLGEAMRTGSEKNMVLPTFQHQ